MSFRHSLLLNNQPRPLTLPYPLAGTLRPGEQVVTRYSPERLRQLIDCSSGQDETVRDLVVKVADGAPIESQIGQHSPPRDYFYGTVDTTGAVSNRIVWRLPRNAGGDGPEIGALLLAPGMYSGWLIVMAGKHATLGGTQAYTRKVAFQILNNNGTISLINGNSQTIGTDVETDAAADITVTFASSGIQVTCLGVASATHSWSASLDLRSALTG